MPEITALENVRRLEQWNREEYGDDLTAAPSPPLRDVGILGAGRMGISIAAAHVEQRVPVVVNDVNEAVLAEAAASIVAELSERIRSQPESVLRLVRTTSDVREAARCELVLEAIVETLPAKLRLYSQLQESLAAATIVASNTSTIPIRRLAEGVPDASRFCGMHFLHPVRQRRLVEIVRGPGTSDATIAAAIRHVRRIGKMPIVVRDGPGFLVNRLLFPYLGEGLQLLREGVPGEAIERAATEFGMAMGPLRLMDEIGLDTTLQAGWVLAAAFPDRIVPSPVLVSLVKAGRLGQKSGAGFYWYGAQPQAAAQHLDKSIEQIIGRWIDPPEKAREQPIACRLILPMLLEATRILEDGTVGDVREIDLALLFGLGFPADKGGLLWWADALGPRRIIDMLAVLDKSEARNHPTSSLERLARADGRFYTSGQGN
jgi:3-hydroxyacyl-CoA dehydrogenase/enoyl-CoA hydratase/3-hydroxybutyryl-CoA epimerase/3-hydroxyacyl-CoA dehydrogenase/enoyl-CoA hydratase/3-hydroxybutyryl-CoA epimerase/enoyl-CoA isomerase